MKNTLKICLSHRQAGDDKVLENWIDLFVKYLKVALKEKNKIPYQFISLDELKEAIGQDEPYLCYLPVFDSGINDDESFAEEVTDMAKFLEDKNEAFSLFKIFRDPTDAFALPQVMYNHKDFRCYIYHKATGDIINTEEIVKPEYIKHFLFRLFDLVYYLERLSETGSAEREEELKGVYLAETSFDLFQIRQSIERELQRHGYNLFPHLPFPLEQSNLVDRTRQDLKKCALSVHLFGEYYTEPREGKEISLLEFQNETAASHYIQQNELNINEEDIGFRRIIWIPEKFEAKDHRQQKFLDELLKEESLHAGADIIRCPVEELKDLIIERLRNEKTTIDWEKDFIDTNQKIYLIHNDVKGEDVKEFSSFLQSSNYHVLSAEDSTHYSEVRNTHKKNLLDCEGLVFFCRHNDEQWLRSKINDALKAKAWGREEDYKFKAIISYEAFDLPEGLKDQDYLMIAGEPDNTWDQLIQEIQN
ncbi:hypothetical protein AB9P05_20265 [Roseivirga sp. BDSF3-8]|uniref:hypothetical protein n=1 Tax=Roseivirga sp. BDSF3-8 TaxID=3241598 RepID=UPI003532501B